MTDSPTLPEPHLEFAFEARVDTAPMIRVGHTPTETLLVFPITGGTVSGRLNGTVLAGGADWATERPEGVTALEARYLIQADDGSVIDVVNRGFHVASAAVMARIESGEDVPETEYYYRTSPVFRTEAPAHAWLTRTVFVGLARSEAGQVCIRFYALA